MLAWQHVRVRMIVCTRLYGLCLCYCRGDNNQKYNTSSAGLNYSERGDGAAGGGGDGGGDRWMDERRRREERLHTVRTRKVGENEEVRES